MSQKSEEARTMAEQNSNWNGILLTDCADPHQSDTKDQMSAKKEKDEEKGTQKDEKRKSCTNR